jgi:hypothetical protein
MVKFNKFLTFTAITTLLFLLCSCSRKIYDSNYKGEPNYESFYLVDTIIIIEPVRIHSPKLGGQFIVSKETLKEYNGKSNFFIRPDVFLLGDDLYRDLPSKNFNRYSYPSNGGCEFVKSEMVIKGLEIFEIKKSSQTFLLGMINANHFNKMHNSYVSFQFSDKGSKIAYYKIVYPLCK